MIQCNDIREGSGMRRMTDGSNIKSIQTESAWARI